MELEGEIIVAVWTALCKQGWEDLYESFLQDILLIPVEFLEDQEGSTFFYQTSMKESVDN